MCHSATAEWNCLFSSRRCNRFINFFIGKKSDKRTASKKGCLHKTNRMSLIVIYVKRTDEFGLTNFGEILVTACEQKPAQAQPN